MQLTLLIALAMLAYIYVGYGIMLLLLGGRREEFPTADPEDLPTVTVLIAAYNEVDSIEATIRNKLELDYPPDLLDLIAVSDESTDGTDEAISSLITEYPGRIRLIRQDPRRGKTAALNLAVPEARGEILVFSDANSIYEPAALCELVQPFADPQVGYVTGKMIYANPDGSVVGDGCTAYMRYENVLRELESRRRSVVGVDGGVDAVRKELYVRMSPDQLPDFVLPLRVVDQGYRVVYAPRAILREEALGSTSQEYRMRVRVTLRALWALWDLRHLFDPRRNALFSWQLISHKLLRYFAFAPQAAALASNLALVHQRPIYSVLMVAQGVFYALAIVGYLNRNSGRGNFLTTAPYYLTLLNVACAHAVVRFLRGQKQVIWKPRVG